MSISATGSFIKVRKKYLLNSQNPSQNQKERKDEI